MVFTRTLHLIAFCCGIATLGKAQEKDSVNSNIFQDAVHFSHPSGFYTHAFELLIINSDSTATVCYSLDGSDPTPHSKVFTSPLHIHFEPDKPNNLSTINTTAPEAEHPYTWRAPEQPVFNATVIKARSFRNGKPASPIYTQTYFVHPDIFSKYNHLPVISIVTDSLHLFDYESGIFVSGVSLDPKGESVYGNFSQRGKDWERPVEIMYFEGNGELAFQQQAGLRVHGNESRLYPMKSLRLYAKKRYNAPHFHYDFFHNQGTDRYKRLLLRNGGQDFATNLMADGLASVVMKNFNFEKQSYQPVVVFINGEFWGIHNLRERIDKHFLQRRARVDREGIEMLELFDGESGKAPESYQPFLDFIKNHDLTENQYYDQVAEQMDIDNFTDYYIAKQFIAVKDWPGNNNAWWKHAGENSKWRWIFLDSDKSFMHHQLDAIEYSTQDEHFHFPNPDWSTLVFRNLLKNKGFRDLYLQKFEHYLENDFSTSRVEFLIDSISELIRPVMDEHVNRWGWPMSYEQWESWVWQLKNFAQLRPCMMIHHLKMHFGLPEDYASGVHCCKSDSLNHLPIQFHVWHNSEAEVLFMDVPPYTSQQGTFTLYNIAGNRIDDFTFSDVSVKSELKIPSHNLDTGVYLLTFKTCEMTTSQKIVVIR